MEIHTYRIAPPPIISEILDNEVVILNLEQGIYYNLNEAGTEVWRLIQENASLDQMVETFEGNREEIREGIHSFLQELLAEKILIGSNEKGTFSSTLKKSYRKPTVQRYQDMKELLLLDPIHEVDQIGWPAPK